MFMLERGFPSCVLNLFNIENVRTRLALQNYKRADERFSCEFLSTYIALLKIKK